MLVQYRKELYQFVSDCIKTSEIQNVF